MSDAIQISLIRRCFRVVSDRELQAWNAALLVRAMPEGNHKERVDVAQAPDRKDNLRRWLPKPAFYQPSSRAGGARAMWLQRTEIRYAPRYLLR